MSQSQSLAAATGNAQKLHGFLDGNQRRCNGHDGLRLDDVLHTLEPEGVVVGKSIEANASVSKQFRDYSRKVNVLNDNRLYKLNSHGRVSRVPDPLVGAQVLYASRHIADLTISRPYGYRIVNPNSAGKASEQMFPSTGHVSPPARIRKSGSGSANTGGKDVTHGRKLNTIKDGPNEGDTSLAAREGEKPLHLITSTRQRLPQIPYQSPSHAIRQDQASDNSPLVAMVDPRNEPEVAVDYLNVNTSGECIEDHHRFTQGLLSFIGHRSSQVSQAGSPSRGAVAPSSSGIESGPANQSLNPQLFDAREGRGMQ